MASEISIKFAPIFDQMTPSQEVSFEVLQARYVIKPNDWVFHQKRENPHSHWAVYRPSADGKYYMYCFGFNEDPQSLFYSQRVVSFPIVITDDKQAIEKTRNQIRALFNI